MPSLTMEDLVEAMSGVREACSLTASRIDSLCQMYQFEVEDRVGVTPHEREAELKYLMLNICNEAKHLLHCFSRSDFTSNPVEEAAEDQQLFYSAKTSS